MTIEEIKQEIAENLAYRLLESVRGQYVVNGGRDIFARINDCYYNLGTFDIDSYGDTSGMFPEPVNERDWEDLPDEPDEDDYEDDNEYTRDWNEWDAKNKAARDEWLDSHGSGDPWWDSDERDSVEEDFANMFISWGMFDNEVAGDNVYDIDYEYFSDDYKIEDDEDDEDDDGKMTEQKAKKEIAESIADEIFYIAQNNDWSSYSQDRYARIDDCYYKINRLYDIYSRSGEWHSHHGKENSWWDSDECDFYKRDLAKRLVNEWNIFDNEMNEYDSNGLVPDYEYYSDDYESDEDEDEDESHYIYYHLADGRVYKKLKPEYFDEDEDEDEDEDDD